MTKKVEIDVQNSIAKLHHEYKDDRDMVNQLLGQIQMARSFGRFADVVSLSKLQYIKENKLYRHLSGKKGHDPDGNEIADVGTFDGFCQSIGLSRSKVDEDLLNLSVFGEEALKNLSAIGAGYRDLRKLRKLPEDERDLIINGESIKVQDKEELIELIEERALAHAKEKETLQKQLDDTKKDNEAKEKIIADKNKKIDSLSITAEKEKLRLASRSKEEAVLEKFHKKWGETSGKLMASVFDAHQDVNQAIEEELLPYTFLQKMLIDVAEAKDLLLEMINLLPDSADPVDTAWLTDPKEDK